MKFPVLLRSCWFGLNHLFRKRLGDLSITTVQFTVLRTISDSNHLKLSQNEIADKISCNKNNLSSIISRLEDLNYIKKLVVQSDKRVNKIILKPKGEIALKKSRRVAQKIKKQVTQDFTLKEVEQLSEYLKRCNKSIPIDS